MKEDHSRASNIVWSRLDEPVVMVARHRDLEATFAFSRKPVLCMVVRELGVPLRSRLVVFVEWASCGIGCRPCVGFGALQVGIEHRVICYTRKVKYPALSSQSKQATIAITNTKCSTKVK